MTFQEQQAAVDSAVAAFPGTFGLRAFPGRVFRVSPRASYFSTLYGVMLYTEVQDERGQWSDFAKGTPSELSAQIGR
jgi:hypothetical protein